MEYLTTGIVNTDSLIPISLLAFWCLWCPSIQDLCPQTFHRPYWGFVILLQTSQELWLCFPVHSCFILQTLAAISRCLTALQLLLPIFYCSTIFILQWSPQMYYLAELFLSCFLLWTSLEFRCVTAAFFLSARNSSTSRKIIKSVWLPRCDT